jgi:hypothetical protein
MTAFVVNDLKSGKLCKTPLFLVSLTLSIITISPEAITVIAWLVWTFQSFGSRNPEVICSHPAPNRFYRDIQANHADEFFMRQGGSKAQQMFRNNGKILLF